ncbi:hypothetical protein B0G75_103551 [Paraburkholderia sp. BL18I3N2]|uniref:hypothetical protein n=1 Tax=Paraburkholderia sp. BL18I3N2 TaxID=1938799 RepID=UPI000D080DB4|nr:hypothetical protein [Paraburkholderia sp. BL18I3N2]PRX33323.1 hypothetical protein B0G75_103551 [Paraburkholderia sp. BL18I3N2]
MHNSNLPPQDLGFPSLGADANSWFKNLGVLLYQGGASKDPSSFPRRIARDEMGPPQLERLPLVQALHRALSAALDSGLPEVMLQQRLSALKMLYRFAERTGKSMTLDSVVDVFCAWTDFMIQRTELAEDNGEPFERDCGPISYSAGYEYCMKASRVLDVALGRHDGLMVLTKMRPPRQHQSNVGKPKHDSTTHITTERESIAIVRTQCNHESIPDLTVSSSALAEKYEPLNLNILLYLGGSAAAARKVQSQIAIGVLGLPLRDRLDVVCSFHEELSTRTVAGDSPHSIANNMKALRKIYGFADEHGLPMTRDAIVGTYCSWINSLLHRTRISTKISQKNGQNSNSRLKNSTAYTFGTTVGKLINVALERHTNIIELTGLQKKNKRPTAIGVEAEKQNLSETFAFGHMLQDVCDALTTKTVKFASLPVLVTLRNGKTLTLRESVAWTKMDQTSGLGKRYSLANARIEAELSMFIGQTGMNLAQAYDLSLRRFFYTGHHDGYQVRDHKERRGGPVLFEVFKEYKSHFERYLEWRRAFFPGVSLLFPLIKEVGKKQTGKFHANFLRVACEQANITYVPPRSLRGTRVNWLLRRTADPDLTAEIGQHARETLLNVYHRPSYQRALGETINFWSIADPTLVPTQAVAPGQCEGKPEQVALAPRGAPSPDCARASGCLWCVNHKDVDSLDYVWALVTFKNLKIIELSKGPSPKNHGDIPPAKLVIDRLDEKLKAFEESSDLRRDWVLEAKLRAEEEDFHPSFGDEIVELQDKV